MNSNPSGNSTSNGSERAASAEDAAANPRGPDPVRPDPMEEEAGRKVSRLFRRNATEPDGDLRRTFRMIAITLVVGLLFWAGVIAAIVLLLSR